MSEKVDPIYGIACAYQSARIAQEEATDPVERGKAEAVCITLSNLALNIGYRAEFEAHLDKLGVARIGGPALSMAARARLGYPGFTEFPRGDGVRVDLNPATTPGLSGYIAER